MYIKGVKNVEKKDLTNYFMNSQDPDVCESFYNDAVNYIDSNGYEIKDDQREALLNHISEMVKRNQRKEIMQVEDKKLFEEVSQESIKQARELVKQLEHISDDETYLLSIHFEVVKYNQSK